MKNQGGNDNRQHNTIRYASAILAPLAAAFGPLIEAGVLPFANMTSDVNPGLIFGLSAAWLTLGLLSFAKVKSMGGWRVGAVIGAYFVLMSLQTWIYGSLWSPFSVLWLLLLLITFVIFNWRGFWIGGGVYLGAAIVSIVLNHQSLAMPIAYEIISVILLLIASVTTAAIYSSQRASHKDLQMSQAREALERDRMLTLINNITDAVFSINSQGQVRTYNSAALNILDTNQKIDGKSINDLMQIEDEEGGSIDVFAELSKDKTIRKREDLIMRLGDDDLLRLEATFAPVQGSGLKSDTPDSYVLILRDITRVKSLEEERDEFISVVSHELRTPVAIAEGSLDNAMILSSRGHHDQSSEAIAEAHRQVIFLAKMVNDLSTLSRAERGISDEAELIDTIDLAHQLHREYVAQAEEKNLQLNLDVIGRPGNVFASRLYLQELLQNFITNAIKYTQEGSVTIRFKSDGDRVRFEVADTGIGIGKADLKKIFSRFYRAEDYRTRETSGTGLGLYVSSKLARKLGCTIDVQSRLNHGSTFGFSLPIDNNH
ncbi:hypothetical protein B7Z17_00450 [Candidatus Saccharibacteria bacterium 32-49-10]|nr:MAG: hypothetical protein B7Z17_00450 [Candidatus Saccharibacteria bacterium 32-49-10]